MVNAGYAVDVSTMLCQHAHHLGAAMSSCQLQGGLAFTSQENALARLLVGNHPRFQKHFRSQSPPKLSSTVEWGVALGTATPCSCTAADEVLDHFNVACCSSL